MGKKKAKKAGKAKSSKGGSKKREVRELAGRVEAFVQKHDVTYDDLAMAGVGVLGSRLPGKKHKKKTKKVAKEFAKLVKRGRRLAPDSIGPAEAGDEVHDGAAEPVISYQAHGGGWYTVEVDGVEVDRVQGEEAAATRAGELLARYAALDADGQRSGLTGVEHSGGGWYDVIVNGVPVDRVRGRDTVHERYGHLMDTAE